MSLIPDSVKETFGDLLEVYTSIEQVKMQKRLVDAQASLSAVGQPTYMQDAQAKAQTTYAAQPISGGVVLAAVAAAALGVYLLVRK